jgi:hypothetical protein
MARTPYALPPETPLDALGLPAPLPGVRLAAELEGRPVPDWIAPLRLPSELAQAMTAALYRARAGLRAWRRGHLRRHQPPVRLPPSLTLTTSLDRLAYGRARDALTAWGLRTVDDLLRFDLGAAPRVRGVGPATCAELDAVLESLERWQADAACPPSPPDVFDLELDPAPAAGDERAVFAALHHFDDLELRQLATWTAAAALAGDDEAAAERAFLMHLYTKGGVRVRRRGAGVEFGVDEATPEGQRARAEIAVLDWLRPARIAC